MYQLLKLPYLYQDLEPYIDTHTIALHYHKHHKNYLDALNKLLMENNYDYRYSLEELLFHINEFPPVSRKDILFNLGGVINHNLYWMSISPNKERKPTGILKEYLERKFGSYENLLKTLKERALKLKGSGYTFLVSSKEGILDIINLPNQELPYTFGYIPLLNIDLWEHSYYLNYENEKAKYLDNFENIIDFTNASKIFNNIINKMKD